MSEEINKNNNECEQEAQDNISVEEDKGSFSLKKEVFEWIYTIALALLIAFFIKGFIFDVVRVDGPSMESTLLDNDKLIITKLGYEPELQDIVILDSTYKKRDEYYDKLAGDGEEYNKFERILNYYKLPTNLKPRYYVKRVIGLPGQTVDIVDGKVLVDDKVLDENYVEDETTIIDYSVEYPVTVQEGHVFVMGDNRPHSKDSRSSELGQVPIYAILGKAQIRIWPFKTFGFVD